MQRLTNGIFGRRAIDGDTIKCRFVSPPQLRKWRRWIGRIQRDILDLNERRTVFREVRKLLRRRVLRNHPYLFDWMITNYATAQAMGVRRQADAKYDVITLARLLKEIELHAQNVTRGWFVAQYNPPLPWKHHDFNRFAPNGSGHVNAKIVKSREALEELGSESPLSAGGDA